jgi:hypothetical protein
VIISRVGELVKRGNIVSQNQPFVHEVPVANGNCQLQIMAGICGGCHLQTLDDPGRFHYMFQHNKARKPTIQ